MIFCIIFTSAFFSSILLLMVVSTTYEVVCISKNYNKSATLSSFSVYSNSIAIFTLKPCTTMELKFVHGIRALSVVWIVICHTYMVSFWMVPAINANSIIDVRFQFKMYFKMLIFCVITVVPKCQ